MLGRLRERNVAHCLIGATALAAHGYSRFTADVDILVGDRVVLAETFWEGLPPPEIRVGDIDDPVPGVVRWEQEIDLDLVLLEGRIPRFALETATVSEGLSCPLATPLALVLLKLEAGGTYDRDDVLRFIDTQKRRNGALWLADLPEKATWMRRSGRRVYEEMKDAIAKL